jgi:chromosome segregation ATPase
MYGGINSRALYPVIQIHKTNNKNMKNRRLVVLLFTIAVFGATSVHGQSKKEQIEMLKQQVDSLQRALAMKSESMVQLEVKVARIEGATDAHKEEIKRLESKSDSLKDALMSSSARLESQAAKIKQLNSDITGLQAEQKDWASKNEALNAELNTLKQTPADTTATAANAKPADPTKAEPKTSGTSAANKPVQIKE